MAETMNAIFEKSVSQIASGFFMLAICAVIVGAIAIAVGLKFGGKTKRQKKAAASLVWVTGLLLIAFLVVPRLFAAS